jgi:copper oxidase (laccase) domain-containing protein
MLAPITAPGLEGSAGIRHGFFTRRGGVSQGIYASLNCGLGSRDDAAAVRENRARVAAHLQARAWSLPTRSTVRPPLLSQRPGPRANDRAPMPWCTRPAVLPLVCWRPTAPGPVCRPAAGVVAAAHAGWRGAIGGVLESTIASMESLGAQPERHPSAVGPASARTPTRSAGTSSGSSCSVTARAALLLPPTPDSRPHFDLPPMPLHRLQRAGVGHAAGCTACTYTHAEDFFSYRGRRRAATLTRAPNLRHRLDLASVFHKFSGSEPSRAWRREFSPVSKLDAGIVSG